MTDFPALMSAPMVKALLREIEQPGSGKTETRRLAWRLCKHGHLQCPFCGRTPTIWQSVKPGDRIWVRETWGAWPHMGGGIQRDSLRFQTDGPPSDPHNAWRWRPSIHLPRRHSRLTLLVTATKTERVQAISEEDAEAEGATSDNDPDSSWRIGDDGWHWTRASLAYQRYWRANCETSDGTSWDSNPEVVALTFQPVLANIDSAGPDARPAGDTP